MKFRSGDLAVYSSMKYVVILVCAGWFLTSLYGPIEPSLMNFGCEIMDEAEERNYLDYRLEWDIDKYTSQMIAGLDPDVPPVNRIDYPFAIENTKKCLTIEGSRYNIHLLFVVKSAVGNFGRRRAVRQTWGSESRFDNVIIRRVFNLGWKNDSQIQQQVEKEQKEFGDIVQGGFIDNYDNNTVKTLMGFKWVLENCPTARFVMFVDDDMYVSALNVLKYLIRPEDYPNCRNTNSSEVLNTTLKTTQPIGNHSTFPFDLNFIAPTIFFGGYNSFRDRPTRNQSNEYKKWYVSPKVYPWKRYPHYPPGGAYILSYHALRKLYYTALYTSIFIIDDVYLGMVARRAGIGLYGNTDCFKLRMGEPDDYKDAIAVHNYGLFGNHSKMIGLWQKQYELQHA